MYTVSHIVNQRLLHTYTSPQTQRDKHTYRGIHMAHSHRDKHTHSHMSRENIIFFHPTTFKGKYKILLKLLVSFFSSPATRLKFFHAHICSGVLCSEMRHQFIWYILRSWLRAFHQRCTASNAIRGIKAVKGMQCPAKKFLCIVPIFALFQKVCSQS